MVSDVTKLRKFFYGFWSESSKRGFCGEPLNEQSNLFMMLRVTVEFTKKRLRFWLFLFSSKVLVED